MHNQNKNNQEKYLENLYNSLNNLENDFRNSNLNNLIISKISKDEILDIGCGSGSLITSLNAAGKKSFGIEPNKKIIQLAKKINPKTKILRGKAEDINKIIKEKIEAIVVIDVLEHIEDDELMIKKLNKQLISKGNLIIVVPAYSFLYGERDRNQGHYRRYSKKKLISLLFKNGFKIDLVRYWNMLGVFPYFFYEKILKKELNTSLRTKKVKGFSKKIIRNFLDFWFRNIENKWNFGFGLSLILIAEKYEKF